MRKDIIIFISCIFIIIFLYIAYLFSIHDPETKANYVQSEIEHITKNTFSNASLSFDEDSNQLTFTTEEPVLLTALEANELQVYQYEGKLYVINAFPKWPKVTDSYDGPSGVKFTLVKQLYNYSYLNTLNKPNKENISLTDLFDEQAINLDQFNDIIFIQGLFAESDICLADNVNNQDYCADGKLKDEFPTEVSRVQYPIQKYVQITLPIE